MRNLENRAFRFGQNIQKFGIFVQMASGVQEKVQNLFGWAHQASETANPYMGESKDLRKLHHHLGLLS